MSTPGDISRFLKQAKTGEQTAIQKLWEAYYLRMVSLARSRLERTCRQAADEEDVALNAFTSFCLGAEAGRFPRLSDRNDLWQVLVMLTVREAANLKKKERTAKRGGGKVHRGAATEAGEPLAAFTEMISREPDPQHIAELAENCRELLDRLGHDQLRAIAIWKMEGLTNREIAEKLSCSVPTVERKLAAIRQAWEQG